MFITNDGTFVKKIRFDENKIGNISFKAPSRSEEMDTSDEKKILKIVKYLNNKKYSEKITQEDERHNASPDVIVYIKDKKGRDLAKLSDYGVVLSYRTYDEKQKKLAEGKLYRELVPMSSEYDNLCRYINSNNFLGEYVLGIY